MIIFLKDQIEKKKFEEEKRKFQSTKRKYQYDISQRFQKVTFNKFFCNLALFLYYGISAKSELFDAHGYFGLSVG